MCSSYSTLLIQTIKDRPARRGQLLTKRFFIKSLLHFCLEIRYPIGSNSVETHVILQEGIFG